MFYLAWFPPWESLFLLSKRRLLTLTLMAVVNCLCRHRRHKQDWRLRCVSGRAGLEVSDWAWEPTWPWAPVVTGTCGHSHGLGVRRPVGDPLDNRLIDGWATHTDNSSRQASMRRYWFPLHLNVTFNIWCSADEVYWYIRMERVRYAFIYW